MAINDTIFRTLIQRGYSIRDNHKIWDVSDAKLWYLTPELSAGFLNLNEYKPYKIKVIDTEFELIERNSEAFQSISGDQSFNLIDLGCGDGTKAVAFIKSLSKNHRVRYCPIDVSSEFIDQAVKNVKGAKFENVLEIKPFVSDFRDLDSIIGSLRNSNYRKNMVLLLGETISVYDVNDLLYTISDPLWKGDVLIVGNGYKVGERFVELDKYKDPVFNKWFINILKGLEFRDEDVKMGARFENGRLEWFYTIDVDKTINHNGMEVKFKKGDEVIVAVQYKYFENEWMEFYELYFSDVELLKDEKKEYALAICVK